MDGRLAGCCLALALTACRPPVDSSDRPGRDVRIWPLVDLTTGASSQGFVTDAPITISFGGTGTAEVFEMGEGRAWEGNIRVVHWPSTELAAGEWALHVSEPPGSVTFEFVPTGDLAEGWSFGSPRTSI